MHLFDFFKNSLSALELSDFQLSIAYVITGLLICSLLALLVKWLVKKVLIGGLTALIKRSKNTYDDVLLDYPVFSRLGTLVALCCFYFFIPLFIKQFEGFSSLMNLGLELALLIVFVLVIFAVLDTLHAVYKKLPIAKNRPILGWVQLGKVFLVLICSLMVISLLFSLDIAKILTGIGATAAILLLVFKDTILGLVSSIQLSTNNMLQVGDWVTVPAYNADGTVLEVTLNTVKIQNWDKTISTVPTYAMVSNSFTNWKGMEESGGRRIKRSININMHTVKFCDDELLARLQNIVLLRPYLEQLKKELEESNKTIEGNDKSKVNGRRLSNLGLFRYYLELYLRAHPKIHNHMTFLVRQLQPTEKGIPLEIYVFSKDQAWANYEAIQADIFDHILASIDEFDLTIFQLPSGEDIQKLLGSTNK